MAPIPVYTNSPVAAKPSGVTPQTTAPPVAESSSLSARSQPADSTTATPTSGTGSYPQAQPGAIPAVPTAAPTTAAHRYAPVHPTPTQPSAEEPGPPPPQPGAVPVPVPVSSIPPPPKVGEKYHPPTPAQHPTTGTPYPPQMSMASPAMPYPSQQTGTSSYVSQSTTDFRVQPPQNLQHPPGYYQNPNASELDRYQRSATHRSEFEGHPAEDSEGVWGVAKKWAQQTGEKLAAAESEVWKKINKE